MTSTLRIYRNTKLKPSDNFCLDGTTTVGGVAYTKLEYYLTFGSKLFKTLNNFQLLKPTLDLVIKVDLSQEILYPELSNNDGIDYVSFDVSKTESGVTTTSTKFYYFVVGKKWSGQSTLTLELRMDTLHTFEWNVDYKPTIRTIVEREHKNRFIKLDNPRQIINYKASRKWHKVDSSTTHEYGEEFHVEAVFSFDTGIDTRTLPNFDIEHVGYEFDFYISEYDESDYNWDFEVHYTDHMIEIEVVLESGIIGDLELLHSTIRRLKIYTELEYMRSIDFYPEGITPVLYKKEEMLLTEAIDSSWNLIYTSGDSSLSPPEPVKCLLVPDNTLTALVPTTTFTISISDLQNNKTYGVYQNPLYYRGLVPEEFSLDGGNENAIDVTIDGATYTLGTTNSGTTLTQYMTFTHLYCYKDSGRIRYIIYKTKFTIQNNEIINQEDEIIASGIVDTFIFPSINYVKNLVYDTLGETYTDSYWEQGTLDEITLKNISQIDRTDSKLYKIIKLPYAPTSYVYEEGEPAKLQFESSWKVDSVAQVFKLEDLNSHFKNTINTGVSNPIYNTLMNQFHQYRLAGSRDDTNESKLFHSDFYQVKFVYDSFAFVFQLERINTLKYYDLEAENFTFNFVTTSTINSKFLFEFPNYILNLSTEDYDNVLPVARNNEITIYNNEYLNYLRTAYHYDLKAKERTISTAKLGLGLGIAGSLVSGTLGVASGNPAVAVSSVFGATTSIASGIVSTINTIAKAEEDFASKQDQLKAQSFSVSGSDDVDLMEYYTQNRAKLVVYEVSPRMRQALADLFYYTGYATNEQKIPSVHTRHYFNFLKCQLNLEGQCYNEEVTEDLIGKFIEGVTFIHTIPNTYKLEDIFSKENYEEDFI